MLCMPALTPPHLDPHPLPTLKHPTPTHTHARTHAWTAGTVWDNIFVKQDKQIAPALLKELGVNAYTIGNHGGSGWADSQGVAAATRVVAAASAWLLYVPQAPGSM